MSRLKALVAVSALFGAAACAPTIGSNGFQAIDKKPADIVAGTDTKETVLAQLGSPSTTSTSARARTSPASRSSTSP